MHPRHSRTFCVSLLVIVGVLHSLCADAQTVSATYTGRFRVDRLLNLNDGPTQMAWGPEGRLYIRLLNTGVDSYAYDKATGALTDLKHAVTGFPGIGLAFHQNDMYLTTLDGSIVKLNDQNANGIWGEPGELSVHIVTGIPAGDHNPDQLLVKGNALYVGIGLRTTNGYSGTLTGGSIDDFGGQGFFYGGQGNTWGDSAYNDTISWIQDLNAVADTEGSANAYADTTLTQYLIQQDDSPYKVTSTNRLIIHSAGTRNPYGICFDRFGDLWFTNNFHRAKTNSDGTSGFGYPRDQTGPDFSMDIHDQLFHASVGADYGYASVNWRGKVPYLDTTSTSYHRVLSTTFDNLFNTGPYVLTDPANPDGLGPSSSSDGCSFFYAFGLPSELQDNIFVARYNGPIAEASPGTDTLDYRDIVAVDTTTGKIRRIASGFSRPLSVFWDGGQRLLIGAYGDKYLYALVALDKPATNVTVTNVSAAVGQAVTLSALMQRSQDGVSVPGKTITFKIDATTIGTAVTASNGVASLRYSVPVSLGAGTHVIAASFSGDADYGSNSATGTLTVYFNTRLTVPNTKANAGQTVPLQATLRRDPDGAAVPGKTITFKVGTTEVGPAVTAANGVATFNYTVPGGFATGNYTITASFGGDPAYHSSSQTGKLQVQRR